MSTLTKVFVVLNVVLSLLLTAGVVTYVNTQTFSKQAMDHATEQVNALKSDNGRLSNELSNQTAVYQTALASKDNTITSLRNEVAAAQQQVAQRDAQLAELTANLGSATTAQTTANDALKAMQVAYAERSKNYDDLRTSYDKLQKQLVDSSLHIDDLTNVVDVTKKQLKYSGEQVAQLQNDLARANSVLKQNGLTAGGEQNASAMINAEPSVPVNAKVEETRTIGGVKYATINVGSADQIAKNMQLKVVDPRSHQFLGYLVVDQVFPHQAIGRLEGPGVNNVQAQVTEVRSQL